MSKALNTARFESALVAARASALLCNCPEHMLALNSKWLAMATTRAVVDDCEVRFLQANIVALGELLV